MRRRVLDLADIYPPPGWEERAFPEPKDRA